MEGHTYSSPGYKTHESVAEEGVKEPINVRHPGMGPLLSANPNEKAGEMYMGQGHHRVASAAKEERAGKEIYVPVIHHASAMQALSQYNQLPYYGELEVGPGDPASNKFKQAKAEKWVKDNPTASRNLDVAVEDLVRKNF
jgi:hypothetical protein